LISKLIDATVVLVLTVFNTFIWETEEPKFEVALEILSFVVSKNEKKTDKKLFKMFNEF